MRYFHKVGELTKDGSVFKEAYSNLMRLMAEAEKRYAVKLSIDSHCYMDFRWSDVYIHGDVNVVNLVIIKHIRWQHENTRFCGYVYPYPSKEMLNDKKYA